MRRDRNESVLKQEFQSVKKRGISKPGGKGLFRSRASGKIDQVEK